MANYLKTGKIVRVLKSVSLAYLTDKNDLPYAFSFDMISNLATSLPVQLIIGETVYFQTFRNGLVEKVILPDNCSLCRGKKGGVRGNENVYKRKILCDYCHRFKRNQRWIGGLGASSI